MNYFIKNIHVNKSFRLNGVDVPIAKDEGRAAGERFRGIRVGGCRRPLVRHRGGNRVLAAA